jgi:uncharacterized protein with NRDE domain
MCLILFAKDQHPTYKIIIAANRDEFFERPTAVANYWEDNPNILGGKDKQSGGTWLGVTKNGRFIAITNYRDPEKNIPNAVSRGKISRDFLFGDDAAVNFLDQLSKNKSLFNGFNLLLSDDGFKTIYHYSNITDQPKHINPGIHGLSNHLLNTPWPKVEKGKKDLAEITGSNTIETNDLIEMLKDDKEAEENRLPKTGISFDLEKKLSPVFISLNGYGTRCSTAILVDKNNQLTFQETSYDKYKDITHKKVYSFGLNV